MAISRANPREPNKATFTYQKSGTTGCELLDPDGRVYGWTVESWQAEILVGLLNWADTNGLVFRRPSATMTSENTEKRPTVGHIPRQNPTLTKPQVQKLVTVLLRNRPDLVLVKTDSDSEKRQIVKVLEGAGAAVIYNSQK